MSALSRAPLALNVDTMQSNRMRELCVNAWESGGHHHKWFWFIFANVVMHFSCVCVCGRTIYTTSKWWIMQRPQLIGWSEWVFSAINWIRIDLYWWVTASVWVIERRARLNWMWFCVTGYRVWMGLFLGGFSAFEGGKNPWLFGVYL